MSVASIFSGNFTHYAPQNVQSTVQQFQQDFAQLGQDLQAGNLSAAQTDFATLQQIEGQGGSSAPAAQNGNPILQIFNQLSQDLQSGNLSGAQQDFANLQQDLQNAQSSQPVRHHHHHGGGEGGGISQLFSQLGQDLQSGNLSSAQQAYSSLEQELQQFTLNGGSSTQPSAATSGVSVTA